MARKKSLSNRIKDAMEHDVIVKFFIVSALANVSEHVINNKEKTKEQMEKSMIHPDAWIEAAERVNKLIKEQ
jgi:hypothetical protein